MTKLTPLRLAVIAVGFLACGFALSCFAAFPTPYEDATNSPRPVKFELGTTYFQGGDSITIDEIRGTSDVIAAGNIYEINGTYKLASHETAQLAANVTTGSNAKRKPIAKAGYLQKERMMTVSKGEGSFTLILAMEEEGNPHVSFYPLPSGESFASVYFGTGDSVYRRSRAEVTDSTTSLKKSNTR